MILTSINFKIDFANGLWIWWLVTLTFVEYFHQDISTLFTFNGCRILMDIDDGWLATFWNLMDFNHLVTLMTIWHFDQQFVFWIWGSTSDSPDLLLTSFWVLYLRQYQWLNWFSTHRFLDFGFEVVPTIHAVYYSHVLWI